MNPTVMMPDWVDRVVPALGWALVLFLAQGLLIGLGTALLLRVVRGRSADLRYGIALSGLLLMAICPVATTCRGLATSPPAAAARALAPPSPRDPAPSTGPLRPAGTSLAHAVTPTPGPGIDPASAPPAPPIPTPAAAEARPSALEPWLPAIVAAWLLGVCAASARLLAQLFQVQSLTRRGLAPAPAEVLEVLERLLARLGLRLPVRCFLSGRVEVPSVVGWIRPTILLPAAGLLRLTARQVEAMLAHELAHIRRHDYLVNLLQASVETALFFHPAVWWLSRRIRAERENCCDDLAVALCDGDRLLLARTLLALEETRGVPTLRLAATGGPLSARIRRLLLPAPAPGHAAAGWAGAGFMAAMAGLLAFAWLSTASRSLKADEPPTILGRVVDLEGHAIPDARVRLYRRDSRFERLNPLVEETQADSEGSFRITAPLEPVPLNESRALPRHVLLADHPGHAVGWRIIPPDATSFRGDLVLTEPTSRTVLVTDAEGKPLEGATVHVSSLGESESSSPHFRDPLELITDNQPLAATTDADGMATLTQLPQTQSTLIARKPGFAGTYAFSHQDQIRLTPSASLSGTLTGPDGQPLPGVSVVLRTDFMWDFEFATTDEQGRYEFKDLRARGWDMNAWSSGMHGNGIYKVWIKGDQLAVPTRIITLEPTSRNTLDLRAEPAGTIRVTVLEEGTRKPVPGVRVGGYDKETGSSDRFDSYTDDLGQVVFRFTPAEITLGPIVPPEGTYTRSNEYGSINTLIQFVFKGGDESHTIVMPRLQGPLVSFVGECLKPDGDPAPGAQVVGTSGNIITASNNNFAHPRLADGIGVFRVDQAPAEHEFGLYASTNDGRLAGFLTVSPAAPPGETPRAVLRLEPTVTAEQLIQTNEGEVLASSDLTIVPTAAGGEFRMLCRKVKSDPEGRIKVDQVVPGLAYRIKEEPPLLHTPTGNVVSTRDSRFDREIVLVPRPAP
jgi:beta-lactamase regulating signal transducer with metallopeptidase domain